MMYEAKIASLTVAPDNNTPMLLLQIHEKDVSVPVMIGLMEAGAIAAVLQGIDFDRPMTHDLFTDFVKKLEVQVVKVEITDIIDNTFYAKLFFSSKNGDFWIDSRPSDAIAMALRSNARIYIHDVVLQKLKIGDFEAADDSEEGERWAEYLSNLDDDDFGKYKV